MLISSLRLAPVTSDSGHSDLERQAWELCQEILDTNASKLAQAHLSADLTSPVGQITRSGYVSELAIYFRRGGDLIDLIEFQIFRDGRPLIRSREHMKAWLESVVTDVLRRASAKS
jgi:hypothetical protein